MSRDGEYEEIVENDSYTYKIELIHDMYADNPREWTNDTTMVCFHSRYDLPHEKDFTEEELKEFISTDNVLWKPLYLHDHGGLSMTTSPGYQLVGRKKGVKAYRWDSGCVGAIYITHDQIREQQSIKGELSEKDLELAELGLSCDIERYNAFLTGDTWGIQISQKVNKCNLPYYQSVADNLAEKDWEDIDSCWGLYGDDGLMEFNNAIKQWGSK